MKKSNRKKFVVIVVAAMGLMGVLVGALMLQPDEQTRHASTAGLIEENAAAETPSTTAQPTTSTTTTSIPAPPAITGASSAPSDASSVKPLDANAVKRFAKKRLAVALEEFYDSATPAPLNRAKDEIEARYPGVVVMLNASGAFQLSGAVQACLDVDNQIVSDPVTLTEIPC